MAKSYKKSYHNVGCCRSQKKWKRDCNRSFRHIQNHLLNENLDETYLHKNYYKFDFGDIWGSPSDGRFYCDRNDIKDETFLKRRFCKFRKHRHSLVWK